MDADNAQYFYTKAVLVLPQSIMHNSTTLLNPMPSKVHAKVKSEQLCCYVV